MSTISTPDAFSSALKQTYHEYRHTSHIPSKARFFSPTCMQVCRPMPNYAALKRETIIQYLYEAAGFQDRESYELAQSSFTAAVTTTADSPKDEGADPAGVKVKALQGKSYYSIRSLKPAEESEILTDEIVAPLGMTPSQLDEMRRQERWVGMRVDLWDDDVKGKGRLIKVKYWWRREEVEGEEKWLQCLHDIMSIGDRDGSEGVGGEALE